AVDVDGVAQRLEGVEADADRQDDPQRERLQMPAQSSGQRHQVVLEEVEVFERAQQPEVEDDAGQQQAPPLPGDFGASQQPGDGEVDQAVKEHQAAETDVPPGVED